MHGYDRVRNVQENVVMRTLKLVHCISLCKNNLNLPMFFFLPCAWLPPPLVHCVAMLAPSLRYADFFVYFYRSRFCSPAIDKASLSQSKG